MNDPAHVADDLPAYALDALDAAERVRVAAHLRECAVCARLLEEYRAVARLLPYGLPLELPPPGARAALLARARSQQHAAVSPSVARGNRLVRSLPALGPLRWVAVGAVFVGLVLWNVRLQLADGDERGEGLPPASAPDGRVVMLAGSAEAPGSSAHLILSADGRRGWLAVSGLPTPPPGRAYQLWFVRPDQSRVSGGVFRVDARGDAVVVLAVPGPLDQFIRAGVTEEPDTGSPGPTGRNMLAGPL